MQLLFKFKSLLLKLKPNFFFLNFYFEFLNIHINHLAQHSMITMALKWHHKNISNKIIILIEFWWSHNVFFGSFDCDYTLKYINISTLFQFDYHYYCEMVKSPSFNK
jgi:hypothetical protein